MSKIITHADYCKLPLRDQAHHALYGRTPDGRFLHYGWTRPHAALHAYVEELEREIAELRGGVAPSGKERPCE